MRHNHNPLYLFAKSADPIRQQNPILMTEAKHFKNLHLQESRLRRQYRQDMEELT
jgi:hypothetical protein